MTRVPSSVSVWERFVFPAFASFGVVAALIVVYQFYAAHTYDPYLGGWFQSWGVLASGATGWVSLILGVCTVAGYLFLRTEGKHPTFAVRVSFPRVMVWFLVFFVFVSIEKLLPIGQLPSAFFITPWRFLVYAALFALVFFAWYGLGRTVYQTCILRRFPMAHIASPMLRFLSYALGGLVVYQGVYLFLGALGLLTPLYVWSLIAILYAVCYKAILAGARELWTSGVEVEFSWLDTRLFAFFVVLLVAAKNAFHVIRPIPIGWDDMGVYMNIPHQIGQTGFTPQALGFQAWSVVMSHGFTLLQSTTAAMFFSFFGGALLLVTLTLFLESVKTGSSPVGSRFLWSVSMFVLPMTMFQNTLDMKIDPSLFAIVCVALTHFFLFLREKNKTALFWSFFLTGLAFTLKPTVFMLLFSLLLVVVIPMIGGVGVIGAALVGAGVLILTDLISMIPNITGLVTQVRPYGLAILIIGLFPFAYGVWRDYRSLLQHATLLALAGGLFFVPLAPWFAKGLYESLKEGVPVTVTSVMNGYPHREAFLLEDLVAQSKADPALIASLKKDIKSTAWEEELNRYLGYDKGAYPLLSQPVAQTGNLSQKGRYVEIGFLFLSCVLLGAFGRRFSGPRAGVATTLWVSFVLVASVTYTWIVFFAKNAGVTFDFLNRAGQGLTLLITLIVFALPGLVYAVLKMWTREPLEQLFPRSGLYIMTFVYWILWLWIANGVIWYGIAGFALLFAVIDDLIGDTQTSDLARQIVAYTGRTLACLWIIQGFLVNHSMTNNQVFAAYAADKIGDQEAMNMMLPIYPQIEEILNADDKAPIYRVGTFIVYFIKNNFARLIDDSQLDYYKYISSDNDDEALYKRFRAMNIRYIVLDMNAATIDRTEERTLIKKYEGFLRFLSQEKYVRLVQNDKGEYMTDATCLKYAKTAHLTGQAFVDVVGANHDMNKYKNCYTQIYTLLQSKNIPNQYMFLREALSQNEQGQASLNPKRGAIALFEIVQ